MKLLEILINGLSMGAIYALLAVGFVIVFKSTGILNFAQGELAMIGAFLCFSFVMIFGAPYLAGFVLSLLLGALLGALIEVVFFTRMVGKPLFASIMVTVGLAGVISSIAGFIWGHDVYSISSPFTNKHLAIAGFAISYGAVYTILTSIVLLVILLLFFNRSLHGVAMKAAAEDPDTAGLMGINVNKTHMIAWAMGSTVAAVAGIFLAEQSFVRISMSHYGIQAMAAAILGGMDSVKGAIIGGAILGLAEGLAANYLSGLEFQGFHVGDVKEVAAFAMMIIILMIRPRGIFGKEKVERV